MWISGYLISTKRISVTTTYLYIESSPRFLYWHATIHTLSQESTLHTLSQFIHVYVQYFYKNIHIWCLLHGFSCDQAALRTLLSVCLSVRPSVCHTFFTMFPSSYHLEIFRSYYHWPTWCPYKRSRSEIKAQGHRGHDPIWRFLDRNCSLNSHMAMKWCTKLDVA